MKIVNVKGMPANAPGIVYCGRAFAEWKGSLLGNPHHVGWCWVCKKTHARGEAIEAFRQGLYEQYKLWKKWGGPLPGGQYPWDIINSLTEESVLGCWCKPLPCHCDVIERAWRWLKETQK